MPGPTITHLERRKIEAGVLIPMVQAFQRAIGEDRANEIAREVILELAREDGERWARQFGRDLAGMDESLRCRLGRRQSRDRAGRRIRPRSFGST